LRESEQASSQESVFTGVCPLLLERVFETAEELLRAGTEIGVREYQAA